MLITSTRGQCWEITYDVAIFHDKHDLFCFTETPHVISCAPFFLDAIVITSSQCLCQCRSDKFPLTWVSTITSAMHSDENDLGASSSLGLGRILASSGVDPAAFSSFFSKTGGNSSSAFADLDAASDNSDKYEDDISDTSLPGENVEELRSREREQAAVQAEQERWYRRAKEMQREQDEGSGTRVKVEKVLDEIGMVKEIWPGYEKGGRLRMTEVFYETPKQRKGWELGFSKRKRRKIGVQECQRGPNVLSVGTDGKLDHLKVAPDTVIPSNTAFLLPSLQALPVHPPTQPRYETPLGVYFESEWIKEAKQVRRKEMTELPSGPSLEQWHEDKLEKILDLADWEKDIVLCSLSAGHDIAIELS